MILPATPDPAQLPDSGTPRINLALQGGGSHGAFTWGVLDALLDDGRIDFEGISGTSAGAMNAVALAHGFAQSEGKPRAARHEAAREALDSFWNGIVEMGALSSSLSQSVSKIQQAPFGILFGLMGGGNWSSKLWTDAMTRYWSNALSPYQRNPFDINPLKDFLEKQVDFERLAAAAGPDTPPGICGGHAGQQRQGRGVLRQAADRQRGDGVGLPAHGVSGGGN